MPTLAPTNFNIVLSVLGGWVSLFGLVSYLCKESFYLSEALISLLAGAAFSPSAANIIRPLDYAGSQDSLEAVTLSFSRLVLGVQLVLAGVQLPSRYLQKQWKPLAILLGPLMTLMWLATGLLIWALVPDLPFLHALAIGACATPTDPVLSNVIVKGRFADHNVPKELQQIIVAESGANDGLGYPFLFLALYLIKYTGHDAASGGAREAISLWFGETWGYTILLSVVYGAVVGWVAKELLHWAEERRFVDRESFLVFAISLALFIVGTCGMIGSDDVLAAFIAGNAFTWDDWFRQETMDDSLQPTVDMLLNVSIFMWLGAVCPWDSFLHNSVVPIFRLIPLGVLILLFRRLPFVYAMHKYIPQIEGKRHAVFVGFFGPVGVSAIFYLYVTLDFLKTLDVDGTARGDIRNLSETVHVVVWFLAICSTVVHGLSIPLGKLGFYIPRTLSLSRTQSLARSLSRASASRSQDHQVPPPSCHVDGRPTESGQTSTDASVSQSPSSQSFAGAERRVFRIGGSLVPRRNEPRGLTTGGGSGGESERDGTSVLPPRTIRFPDDAQPSIARSA